jgi:hypothetical protein
MRPGIDLQDMYTRMSVFFDHYLKDSPQPKWLTEGVAFEKKQIESGLETDLSGIKP